MRLIYKTLYRRYFDPGIQKQFEDGVRRMVKNPFLDVFEDFDSINEADRFIRIWAIYLPAFGIHIEEF